MAAASPSSAQTHDLGEVTLALVPAHPRSVMTTPLDVPDPSEGDLPASAVAAHTRWRTARREAADAQARAAAASSDAERALISDTLPALGARVGAAQAELLRALVRSSDTLSRPALLVLGMLQHYAAEDAWAAALDGCATDCPDALDDSVARETWARVTGTDVLAGHALYQRAQSLGEQQDLDAAAALLESLLALEGLPRELVAVAARDLGLISMLDHEGDVARTYGRCAALAIPGVSPRCALLAADAFVLQHREADALAALAPVLASEAPERDEARDLAASIVARAGHGGASRLPRTLAPAVRANLLDRAAILLLDDGLLAFALEALAAAQAIEASPSRAGEITRVEHGRSAEIDTPERWLRRALGFCVGPAPTFEGTFTLRGRFGPHGAVGLRLAVESDPQGSLGALRTCMRDRAPPPESPLRGSFTAHVHLQLE